MSSPSISDRVGNQVDLKDRRCTWVGSDPLMVGYHDTEWGVPVHDDQKLFEFMVLDARRCLGHERSAITLRLGPP